MEQDELMDNQVEKQNPECNGNKSSDIHGSPIKEFLRKAAVAVFSGVSVTMIVAVVALLVRLYSVPDRLIKIEDRLSSIETDNNGLDRRVAVLEALSETRHSYMDNKSAEKDGETQDYILDSNDPLADQIKKSSFVTDDDVYMTKPVIEANVRVIVGGKEFELSDIHNQRLVLAYEENGQQVFFVGQINENNQWDGECLVNVYKNEELIIATEATYDNGERLDYEQLYSDNKEWIYSLRIDNGTDNDGDTWKYEWYGPIKQVVSFEEPKSRYIFNPERLKNGISDVPISHYHGKTSDGKYNDDSGEAFCISYFKDGTTLTRTVYKGKFADGQYQDTQDSDSWYITRERPDEDGNNGSYYMYYKGRFNEGHTIEESKRKEGVDIFIPDITREFADEQIEGELFENEIRWDENGFAE